jgi:hypothetical protein
VRPAFLLDEDHAGGARVCGGQRRFRGAALKQGMEVKAVEFIKNGAELYRKQ